MWHKCGAKETCKYLTGIGVIMVFDAILTGRQSGQKLQCLYGNPIKLKLNFSEFVNQNV